MGLVILNETSNVVLDLLFLILEVIRLKNGQFNQFVLYNVSTITKKFFVEDLEVFLYLTIPEKFLIKE